jgi:quercetin dioxygenase-like cupin family protein
MSVQPFVLRPDQHEPALNVVGTQVTVLASNAATQSYGITLQQGEEGTGPPPHSHDWDEAFYILKGEIQFLCDGKVYDCNAGTLVHVPRGTVHGFSYGSGGGQMLEITGAGALAAQMFTPSTRKFPQDRRIFQSCLMCSSVMESLLRCDRGHSAVRPEGSD